MSRLLFCGSLHNLGEAPGIRLAPPTSAPSISGCDISAPAFSGFTLPPYWMRTRSAVRRVRQLRKRFANKCVCFLCLLGCGITAGADSPDWLVGDDSFVRSLLLTPARLPCSCRRQNFFHTASLALLQRFTRHKQSGATSLLSQPVPFDSQFRRSRETSAAARCDPARRNERRNRATSPRKFRR